MKPILERLKELLRGRECPILQDIADAAFDPDKLVESLAHLEHEKEVIDKDKNE